MNAGNRKAAGRGRVGRVAQLVEQCPFNLLPVIPCLADSITCVGAVAQDSGRKAPFRHELCNELCNELTWGEDKGEAVENVERSRSEEQPKCMHHFGITRFRAVKAQEKSACATTCATCSNAESLA